MLMAKSKRPLINILKIKGIDLLIHLLRFLRFGCLRLSVAASTIIDKMENELRSKRIHQLAFWLFSFQNLCSWLFALLNWLLPPPGMGFRPFIQTLSRFVRICRRSTVHKEPFQKCVFYEPIWVVVLIIDWGAERVAVVMMTMDGGDKIFAKVGKTKKGTSGDVTDLCIQRDLKEFNYWLLI